jgi:hypothetical protein
MPRMWNASLVLLLMFLAPHSALAQDAAEAAAATSSSGGTASAIKAAPARLMDQAAAEAAAATSSSGIAASGAKAAPVPGINPQPSSSPHLVAREGPAPDELNRKEFEESAGRDAGKLLMRSTPTGAQVFVNGRMVGKAPLLLILAPGKYRVEMRGQRQNYGEVTVGLLPNHTQEVALTLAPLYPTRVSIR